MLNFNLKSGVYPELGHGTWQGCYQEYFLGGQKILCLLGYHFNIFKIRSGFVPHLTAYGSPFFSNNTQWEHFQKRGKKHFFFQNQKNVILHKKRVKNFIFLEYIKFFMRTQFLVA